MGVLEARKQYDEPAAPTQRPTPRDTAAVGGAAPGVPRTAPEVTTHLRRVAELHAAGIVPDWALAAKRADLQVRA